MRKSLKQPDTVRFIIDCRDGRLDQMVPREKAKALYHEGKIAWDVTNGAYTGLGASGDVWEFNRLFDQPIRRRAY